MPVERIPLLGEYNTRGATAADPDAGTSFDYRLVDFVPRLVADNVSRKLTPYIEKRTGLGSLYTVGSSTGSAIHWWAVPALVVTCRDVSSSGNSTVYVGTTSVGTTTGGTILNIAEGRFSSLSHLMFTTGNTAWYLPSDSYQTTAYTADGNNSTTITDIKIGGVNSTAGLYPGQKLTAASNIVAGTRVVSVNSGAFTAVLDTATTGGAFSDLAITKEPLAKITDADFPTGPTYMAEMGGRAYAIDTASLRIYESDINNIASWSATAYVTMNAEWAGTVASLAVINNRLYAFSHVRIEVYANNNNQSGAVISRIDEATLEMGAGSIGYMADTAAAFIGYTRGATAGVFMLTASGLEKISTPTIDSILEPVLNTIPSIFRAWGQTVVTIPASSSSSAGANLVYFVESKKWAELSWTADLFTGSTPYAAATTFAYGLDTDTGTVYRLLTGSTSFQDNGVTFTSKVQTSKITHGTQNRKFIHAAELVTDKQSSGTVTLEYSDDDYATWTTWGTFDLTSMKPRLTLGGGSYEGGRAYRLTHAVNAAFRAVSLIIEYSVGSV